MNCKKLLSLSSVFVSAFVGASSLHAQRIIDEQVTELSQCIWSQQETGFDWVQENIKNPGEGIVIAQLDTGYLPSPYYDIGSDVSSGLYLPIARLGAVMPVLNWVETAALPLDFPGYEVSLWGHGSSVAGLFLNRQSKGAIVEGLVPYSRLIPYRISPFVISGSPASAPVFSPTSNIARALRNAIDQGADVVNLSFASLFDTNGPEFMNPSSGGIGIKWSPGEEGELKSAFDAAGRAGVIVVVAGGHGSPINIMPATANNPNVIAVAGTKPGMKPWEKSMHYEKIALSAPADRVCYSRPFQDNWNGDFSAESLLEITNSFLFRKGGGTTFSATHVTSAAALWLQAHPEVPKKERAKAFREALLDHGTVTPENWPASGFGKGILNVQKLLEK